MTAAMLDRAWLHRRAPAVQLVLLDLGSSVDRSNVILESLSEDELNRRDRFRFAEDRQRYAIGRGALRLLLGRLLDQRPDRVAIVSDRQGKPFVEGSPVRFNLSHSGTRILYAFCLGKEVGVDIERLRPIELGPGLVRTVFSKAELEQWKALAPTSQSRAFYETWTRKEALLKAFGTGLSIEPHTLELSFVESQSIEPGIDGAPQWSVRSLDVGDDYAAAIAVEGSRIDVTLHRWEAVIGES